MQDSILFSLQYTRDSLALFVYQQPLLFIIIGVLVLWSIIAQLIKSHLKKKYLIPFENKINTKDKYFYIRYFKKIHTINTIWILLVLTLLFIYLLTKIQFIGSVLAIWVGAVILTFQTFIVSFLMYFVLMRKYQVWDHIKIHIEGNDIQGEILNIWSLHMGIAGKNDYWENTDQYHNIPNNQLWLHPICKINLSHENYTKESINIPYEKDTFIYSFDETVKKLQDFLDETLELRAAAQVGNYKTYIWVRYKMSYCYQEGKTNIRIWFITRRKDETGKLYKILSFIESLKKQKSE